MEKEEKREQCENLGLTCITLSVVVHMLVFIGMLSYVLCYDIQTQKALKFFIILYIVNIGANLMLIVGFVPLMKSLKVFYLLFFFFCPTFIVYVLILALGPLLFAVYLFYLLFNNSFENMFIDNKERG
jgi:membrane-associated HD superfamily phosphohydrolase